DRGAREAGQAVVARRERERGAAVERRSALQGVVQRPAEAVRVGCEVGAERLEVARRAVVRSDEAVPHSLGEEAGGGGRRGLPPLDADLVPRVADRRRRGRKGEEGETGDHG